MHHLHTYRDSVSTETQTDRYNTLSSNIILLRRQHAFIFRLILTCYSALKILSACQINTVVNKDGAEGSITFKSKVTIWAPQAQLSQALRPHFRLSRQLSNILSHVKHRRPLLSPLLPSITYFKIRGKFPPHLPTFSAMSAGVWKQLHDFTLRGTKTCFPPFPHICVRFSTSEYKISGVSNSTNHISGI